MRYKKLLGAASAALMVVIVFTLALAPAAGAASKYKVLYRFAPPANGANPYASLILAAAGNLYGTTYNGGASGVGTVFKLAPNQDGSWTESVLHSFNGSDGANPRAGLIFDAAGSLYGTTSFGGASNAGTVFKLAPNQDGSWTESVLHSFHGSDGANPYAGLIFDAAGNLYGTTQAGGASLYGTVFKLAPNQDGSRTESVLHKFNGSDGANPYAGLIFDAAGNLYGTTYQGTAHGRGTVFKLAPNQDGSWKLRNLHSFHYFYSARFPSAGLIFDAAGNLYGTTSSGDEATGGGAAFKLSPNQDGSWAYSVVHPFQGKPALNPFGGLVLGSAGTLYGTTADCTRVCQGVVYQITP
jgi:uncharacterized repeat protein (TIGR03803 family)